MTRNELEYIAVIAEKNDFLVFADCFYEKLVYDGHKHISFASILWNEGKNHYRHGCVQDGVDADVPYRLYDSPSRILQHITGLLARSSSGSQMSLRKPSSPSSTNPRSTGRGGFRSTRRQEIMSRNS